MQQFYIRLRLQHGELGDTELEGRVLARNGWENAGFRPRAAPGAARGWGRRLSLRSSQAGTHFPL